MRSLACGVLSVALLVGCGLSTDQIGETVKILMQQKFDSDAQFKEWNLYVTRVLVLKQGENRYQGMATVMYEGKPHDIPVEITANGSGVDDGVGHKHGGFNDQLPVAGKAVI